MEANGRVKWFNDVRGFGFIAMNNGDDVYVHCSAIQVPGYKTLNEGDYVHAVVVRSSTGLVAEKVYPIGCISISKNTPSIWDRAEIKTTDLRPLTKNAQVKTEYGFGILLEEGWKVGNYWLVKIASGVEVWIHRDNIQLVDKPKD
jgi:cold shock protein